MLAPDVILYIGGEDMDRCEGCGGEDCCCCEVYMERQADFNYENGFDY